MNKVVKSIIGAALFAGMVASVTAPAQARTASASMGQPADPAQYGCFHQNEWNGGFGNVINECGTQQRYCTALTTDTSGKHEVVVDVLAPDTQHNISCFAIGATQSSADNIGWTGAKSPQQFGVAQAVDLGFVVLPNSGSIMMCCDMQPGSSLNSVDWTP
jgi:hypothetical protein